MPSKPNGLTNLAVPPEILDDNNKINLSKIDPESNAFLIFAPEKKTNWEKKNNQHKNNSGSINGNPLGYIPASQIINKTKSGSFDNANQAALKNENDNQFKSQENLNDINNQ